MLIPHFFDHVVSNRYFILQLLTRITIDIFDVEFNRFELGRLRMTLYSILNFSSAIIRLVQRLFFAVVIPTRLLPVSPLAALTRCQIVPKALNFALSVD